MIKDKFYYQSLIHQLIYIADIINTDYDYFPAGRLHDDYLCCIEECIRLCKKEGGIKNG